MKNLLDLLKGEVIALGQRLEELLHHPLGDGADVQPLDEANCLLPLVRGDVIRP